MKQLLLLIPICFLFLITSCGDDTTVLPELEVGNVNLTFKAKFGAEEFDFNSTEYEYEGMEMNFSKFDFFISNVALYKNVDAVGADPEKTELFEIDFIDLTQNNNAVSIEISDVPAGEYDGILFSIGVPSDLNAQEPGDFSVTHPLGLTNVSHYWADWNSYIFSKLEGRLDISGNEDYVFFSYHTGSDPLFTNTIEKSISVDLNGGASETINFEIDVQNIFLNSGALDIQTYPNSHSLSEITGAIHVMDNFGSSISVD